MNRATALIISAVLLVFVLLLLVWLVPQSNAPWYTFASLPLFWLVVSVLLCRKKVFYYINEAEGELQAATVFGKKLRCVTSLRSIIRVEQMARTHEVKLTTGSGTSYLKLKDGEQFIEAMQDCFARLYPDSEKDKEPLDPKSEKA